MTTSSPAAPAASESPEATQLAPFLSFPRGPVPISAVITYAASPVHALLGWFHLPSDTPHVSQEDDDFAPELGAPLDPVLSPLRDQDKWIVHGQRAARPPHVHACCAPKSLQSPPTDHTHDVTAEAADPDDPQFFDLLLRPPAAWGVPATCGYLVRNVFKYPGDNLVLTLDYPDFVARAAAPLAAPAGCVLEFDCATLHASSSAKALEEHGRSRVHRGLADLADKLGADWVCCEGTLVVERIPLVAQVKPVGSG